MATSKGEGNGSNLERKRGDTGENEAQMKEAISAESQKGTEHEIWPQQDLWLNISSFFLTLPSLPFPELSIIPSFFPLFIPFSFLPIGVIIIHFLFSISHSLTLLQHSSLVSLYLSPNAHNSSPLPSGHSIILSPFSLSFPFLSPPV